MFMCNVVVRHRVFSFSTGMPQKPKLDAFGDLLGPNFNPAGKGGPKTLSDMKTNQFVEDDPDKAKVGSFIGVDFSAIHYASIVHILICCVKELDGATEVFIFTYSCTCTCNM